VHTTSTSETSHRRVPLHEYEDEYVYECNAHPDSI